ncbi:uncharacterized protein VP01_12111g1, partial [Puccinia sorghi]
YCKFLPNKSFHPLAKWDILHPPAPLTLVRMLTPGCLFVGFLYSILRTPFGYSQVYLYLNQVLEVKLCIFRSSHHTHQTLDGVSASDQYTDWLFISDLSAGYYVRAN